MAHLSGNKTLNKTQLHVALTFTSSRLNKVQKYLMTASHILIVLNTKNYHRTATDMNHTHFRIDQVVEVSYRDERQQVVLYKNNPSYYMDINAASEVTINPNLKRKNTF